MDGIGLAGLGIIPRHILAMGGLGIIMGGFCVVERATYRS